MSTGLAIAMCVLSIAVSVVVTGVVVVRLPSDHFVGDHCPSKSWLVRLGRNVGGALLIALGIVLSFPGVPGQGVLTILLGIMCLDVPGKRRAELWLVRKPRVHRGIDALRARYGKAALELPPSADDDSSATAGTGEGDASGGTVASAPSGAGARTAPGELGVAALATAGRVDDASRRNTAR